MEHLEHRLEDLERFIERATMMMHSEQTYVVVEASPTQRPATSTQGYGNVFPEQNNRCATLHVNRKLEGSEYQHYAAFIRSRRVANERCYEFQIELSTVSHLTRILSASALTQASRCYFSGTSNQADLWSRLAYQLERISAYKSSPRNHFPVIKLQSYI
jgi:hypothetical protein